MSFLTGVLFAAGLLLLVAGAELFVRGASRLAVALGVPPLVIGLTIVAYGTSAPELAVGVQAAAAGQNGVTFGNVVGSNIFNVLFILGISAVISPLVVHRQLVRWDIWVMLGAAVLGSALSLDGTVSHADGFVLMLAAVGYTFWCIRTGQKQAQNGSGDLEDSAWSPKGAKGSGLVMNLVLMAVGLGLLVWGADWLVDSAISIAKAWGLSELIIGLTIVAAGTSLPELATSIVASLRGQRDIAVGNVVGSNIFNILAVLGASAAVAPAGIAIGESSLRLDIPVMLAVSLACVPIFFTGYRIDRWEGFLFLGYYAAYVCYLILATSGHASAGLFRVAMLWFVAPLTAVTLGVLALRSLRKGQG